MGTTIGNIISDIGSAGSNIISSLTKGGVIGTSTQLTTAQQTALAQASSQPSTTTIIAIAGGALLLVVIIMVMRKSL